MGSASSIPDASGEDANAIDLDGLIDYWARSLGPNDSKMDQTAELLKKALPLAHLDKEIANKVKLVLGASYWFTGNLEGPGHFQAIQDLCVNICLDLGEPMAQYYKQNNLQESLGPFEMPTADAFAGGADDVFRQDNSAVGLPSDIILELVGLEDTVRVDRVAAMTLTLLADMLDSGFKGYAQQAAEKHQGEILDTEPKGFMRMMNKAASPADHRQKQLPRTMCNIDIIRLGLSFGTVADLTSAAEFLQSLLGDVVRMKNMYAFDEQRAKAQLHYRTVMINWLYDPNITYGELVARPENVALLDSFVEAPPGIPGEPWVLWREDARIAVAVLRSSQVANRKVRMICETQLLLDEYLKGRKKMHLLYKIVRASNAKQLFLDFQPKQRSPVTYAEAQLLALENARKSLQDADVDRGALLFDAAGSGHVDAVLEILKNDSTRELVNKPVPISRSSNSPILNAAWRGEVGAVRALIAAGADVNIRNPGGIGLAYHGVMSGILRVIRPIIEAGANLDFKNDTSPPAPASHLGRAALWKASNEGFVDIVRALVEAGANVNLGPKIGGTPIYTASEHGFADVVSVLLAGGADPNQATASGETPLSIATKNGFANVVDVLSASPSPGTSENSPTSSGLANSPAPDVGAAMPVANHSSKADGSGTHIAF